jgi:hypothetical protein
MMREAADGPLPRNENILAQLAVQAIGKLRESHYYYLCGEIVGTA